MKEFPNHICKVSGLKQFANVIILTHHLAYENHTTTNGSQWSEYGRNFRGNAALNTLKITTKRNPLSPCLATSQSLVSRTSSTVVSKMKRTFCRSPCLVRKDVWVWPLRLQSQLHILAASDVRTFSIPTYSYSSMHSHSSMEVHTRGNLESKFGVRSTQKDQGTTETLCHTLKREYVRLYFWKLLFKVSFYKLS